MKRNTTGKVTSSKKTKITDDQVAIAASLPKHQGIPDEIISCRTRKGRPEYEIKWVGWIAAHNTLEPITNLADYEGIWLLRLRRFGKKIMTRSQ